MDSNYKYTILKIFTFSLIMTHSYNINKADIKDLKIYFAYISDLILIFKYLNILISTIHLYY